MKFPFFFKNIFTKEINILILLFLLNISCNNVYGNSINPKLSKSKSNNIICQNFLSVNSEHYCWEEDKYVKTSPIADKSDKSKYRITTDGFVNNTFKENSKLAASSPSKNTHLNQITNKFENSKYRITTDGFVNNTFKENSKLIITPIIKRVQEEKPKEKEPNPGLSFGIPSAMGSSWKDVFISVAYTADYDEGLFTWHNKNNSKVADGSMNFGFGFGDPNESIGGEISVGIISLFSQGGQSGFGADGTAGIKFHKAMPSLFNTHAAISWTNPIKWGEATKKDTIYGVISKEFELRPDTKNKFFSLLTLGVGTGSHRSNRTIDDNRNDPNFFGGYGVQILPRASFASSWNGNAFNAGLGLSPFDFPLNFSIGISDITNNSTNGPQFNVNTGYSFRF